MSKWGQKEYHSESMKFAARVVGTSREIYTLGRGNVTCRGELSGHFRYHSQSDSGLPVVGDWVVCEAHNDLWIISEIIPRVSLVSRKVPGGVTEEQPLAANINVVAIVQGLDGGRNFTPRGLERYLTLAWNSGAQPFVILNKADLSEDPESLKNEAEFLAPGVDILITSAQDGRGMEELKEYCSGKTVIFVGPSGVGKSAITNGLLGDESQKTGANRKGDLKGRHTTTSSQLFALSSGGYLIDSPGLKEVQLWGEEDGVNAVFQEIEEWSDQCRFGDCQHQGEPGCAVQEALSKGLLDQERFQSYWELKKELAYLESRKQEKGRSENRSKGISKMIKAMKSGKAIY